MTSDSDWIFAAENEHGRIGQDGFGSVFVLGVFVIVFHDSVDRSVHQFLLVARQFGKRVAGRRVRSFSQFELPLFPHGFGANLFNVDRVQNILNASWRHVVNLLIDADVLFDRTFCFFVFLVFCQFLQKDIT